MMPRRLLPIAILAVSLQSVVAAEPSAAVGHFDPTAIGSGKLLWNGPLGLTPLPAVDISVTIEVAGVMARGSLTQTFTNPTDEVIEAIYVFPLPERAAVDRMELRIGDRRVVSVVRERAEAKRIYEAAKQEQRKASLVDQRRPNLFSTSLANINPGEAVDILIEYVEEVAYENGEFALSFPLTYTPRFLPRSDTPNDTAGEDERAEVGAAAPAPPVSDGCFAPSDSTHAPRAVISATIRPGLSLARVRSPSHAISVREERGDWTITTDESEVPADRDFILRWSPQRGSSPAGTVLIEEREDQRYGLLMLVPPTAESEAGWGLPTSTLFIIDVSSSMDGPSIRQARRALRAALDSLRPGDSFNLLRFNDTSAAYRERFQAVTVEAIEKAGAWVDRLEASGGTDIAPAVVRGLGMMAAADPWPAQRVILITDGAVGNEEDLFRRVSADLGQARFHVIGIGSAPNRFLMRRLSRLGRGACVFITAHEEVGERMSSFLGRIDRPVLVDLSIDWEGKPPLEIYPDRLPDLYAGEPLYLSFRFDPRGATSGAVLHGRLADESIRTELDLVPGAPSGSGVATRWARARVESALDRLHRGADTESIRAEVVGVARTFNLVTRYTSLVAVEEFRTATGVWTTRTIPAGLPRGSTLLGSTLPQGGTGGPLLTVAGLLLLSLAGGLYLMTGRAIR